MSAHPNTYDLAGVLQALEQTTFGDLLEPAAIASMTARGLQHELFPYELPVVRRGLDEDVAPPFYEVQPTLADLEAEPDKEKLAYALLINGITAQCERSRALILSVANAGWIGAIAQGQLLPEEPKRKIYPWWYNPHRAPPPRYRNLPSLFKLFEEA